PICWLLVAGRLPFAAARQGLGPAALARIPSRTGTPVLALMVNSALSGLFVLLYFNGTLLEAYNFIALASTATSLVAIGAACLAEIVLVRREPERFTARQQSRGPMTGLLGFLIVLLMIAGSGLWVVLLTLLAAVLPI